MRTIGQVKNAASPARSDRLDALLDAAGDAMVMIDNQGLITRFNRAAERVFGYAAHEVLNQNLRMLIPQPYREEHDRYMSRFLETPEPRVVEVGREVIACRRDGSTFPIELSVGEFNSGNDHGFVGIVRDVSERHLQESRLRHNAEQLRLLFEFAPTPVALTDHAGRIQNANAAFLALLGHELTDLCRFRLSELVEPVDRAGAVDDFEQVRAGTFTRQREVRLRHRLGHVVSVLLYSGCARDKDGRPLFHIAELLDRSALHQATDEVATLRDRLAHSARLGTMGEMVSGIAHELNQPLAAINNYASACRRLLAAGEATPAELAEVLDKISRQAERAGQVIRGLRAMVRQRDVERMPLHLNPLIEEVARLAELDLRASTQHLVLDLAPELPCFLGDGVQIQQVVMNLIRNAVEAMRSARRSDRGGGGDEGGNEVRVTTGLGADGALEIRVADQGPGLALEVEAHLFDPFVTTKSEGMGLGLSICKSIAQFHAGELSYRRLDSGGAEFVVRLPVAETADA